MKSLIFFSKKLYIIKIINLYFTNNNIKYFKIYL